jgi:hypothetical protein
VGEEDGGGAGEGGRGGGRCLSGSDGVMRHAQAVLQLDSRGGRMLCAAVRASTRLPGQGSRGKGGGQRGHLGGEGHDRVPDDGCADVGIGQLQARGGAWVEGRQGGEETGWGFGGVGGGGVLGADNKADWAGQAVSRTPGLRACGCWNEPDSAGPSPSPPAPRRPAGCPGLGQQGRGHRTVMEVSYLLYLAIME